MVSSKFLKERYDNLNNNVDEENEAIVTIVFYMHIQVHWKSFHHTVVPIP